MGDAEAQQQLTQNTKANAVNKQLPDVAEEDEEDEEAGGEGSGAAAGAAAKQGSEEAGTEKPESEFKKWFWENRGDLNRAWKKRRRDALKVKRLSDNKKVTTTGGRRAG